MLSAAPPLSFYHGKVFLPCPIHVIEKRSYSTGTSELLPSLLNLSELKACQVDSPNLTKSSSSLGVDEKSFQPCRVILLSFPKEVSSPPLSSADSLAPVSAYSISVEVVNPAPLPFSTPMLAFR